MHLEAQVEVAKVEGAGSRRPGAPCFPNLLVVRTAFSVFVGDSSSTLPRGHCPRQPKVSMATVNWAPCQAKGAQFIRREVPFKTRKGRGALEVEGRAK